MQLSIIIPSYNYGELLPRAVKSATGRADDAEIIIVDDGSTDHTAIVAEALIQEFPDVRYVYQENRGPAAARNYGIHVSHGDYILFLDADDELTDAAIPAVLMAIQEHPNAEFFVAPHLSVRVDSIPKEHRVRDFSSKPIERFTNYLLAGLTVCHGASFSHRTLFERVRYPEQHRSGEDVPVFAWSLLLAETVKIPVPLVKVHKHQDSLRHSVDSAKSAGLGLVATIFDFELLPPEAQAIRSRYTAKRALSLFRTCYVAGDFHDAGKYYSQAIQMNPSVVFHLSYTAKFLRMRLQQIRG